MLKFDKDTITGPLKGVRILDFTQAFAGPYATMLLADLGATVIKIESPNGDSTRNNGPYLGENDRKCRLSGYNISVNRNKYNLCVNLKTEEGQKIADELVKQSDAMIFNYSSPRVMAKFNLSYDRVKELNPKIVYVSMSGYGTNQIVGSLHEDKPTVDIMMQAECGSMGITGSPDGKLYKWGPGVGDSYTGTVAAVALLAGLHSAKETGKGQFVDIAMLDSMMLLTERIFYQYSYTHVSPGPIGNNHPMQAPYSIFPCKDGWICIVGNPNKYWERLCNAMDMPQYINDERYNSQDKRKEHETEVNAIVESWTKDKTKKEALAILDSYSCLASPVNTAQDIFEDPHVRAREMIVEVEGDPITGEKVEIAGTPFKFSDTPTRIRHRSAMMGENSEQILKEFLHYSDDQIKDLEKKDIVIAHTPEEFK